MKKAMVLMFFAVLTVLASACNCGPIPAVGTDGDAGMGCVSDQDCTQPCADLGFPKSVCASRTCVCVKTQSEAIVVLSNEGSDAVFVPPQSVDTLKVGITSTIDLDVLSARVDISILDERGDGIGAGKESLYGSELGNLRVVDVGSGGTVMGPMGLGACARKEDPTGVWRSCVLTEDFELAAKVKRQLAIRLDVGANFPVGYGLKAVFSLISDGNPVSTTLLDRVGGQNLAPESLVGNPVVGSVAKSAPPNDPIGWTETVHPGGIVLAGSSEVLSVRYQVYNTSATNPLRSLTVINDLEGAFDQPQDTLGVATVRVSCSPPSGSGNILNFSGSLVNGEAKLANLNCYDESGRGLEVDVAFDVPDMASVGESLSGARVRLGVREDSLKVYGQDQINSFMVRKSKPTLTKMAGLSTTLVNGENRQYGLTVNADNAGAISMGRLTFQVDSDVALAGFRFYRGSTLLSPSAVNIFSETADLGSASGNPLTGNLIGVSFNQEEVVAAGTSQSYTLAATATGVLVGSAVVTRLLGDDDRLLQIASPTYNPVTGRIHATDGSALFSNSAGLTQAKPMEGVRIVWSDQSANTHSYPTVANGLVVAGSGSCDWTNGWGLGVESLSSHTLTQ